VRFNKEDAGHTRRGLNGSAFFGGRVSCGVPPEESVASTGTVRRRQTSATRLEGQPGTAARRGHLTRVPTPRLGILVVVLNETTPEQLPPFSYNHPPSWPRRNSLKKSGIFA